MVSHQPPPPWFSECPRCHWAQPSPRRYRVSSSTEYRAASGTMTACGRCLMGGSSSAGFCCAYASPSTRHGAPLRTDVDARDISSGPQARAQGQAQAVQAVQAEQKRKATANNASTRLAGVNAREREPGEGWRVLETAVVRVQAGGANCCTGESTRLATDWTASRKRTERMARERQSQVGIART